HGGAVESELLGNLMLADGGTNLFVTDDSRTGFFSDYNILHAENGGDLVRFMQTEFKDILNWQRDLGVFDQHSMGTTIIDPFTVKPYLTMTDDVVSRQLPSVANQRRTSPATDGGDPLTKVQDAVATNRIANSSFENGLTNWTSSPTLSRSISNSTSYDGDNSLDINSSVSGVLSQIIDLTTAGVDLASVDASRLDVIGSVRLRTAGNSDSTLRLEIAFRAADDSIIKLSQLDQPASNDRWYRVGDRLPIPAGTRTIVYKIVSDGGAANGTIERIDDAYLAIVDDQYAPDSGYRAGVREDYETADGPRIYLRSPDLYVDWERDLPKTIRWESFDVPVNEPVRIDLMQDSPDGPEYITTITTATANDGEFAWTPVNSGIDYGTHGLRLHISLANALVVFDRSFEAFSVPENTTTFFANDDSIVDDSLTTAIGSHRNTGRVADSPKPSLAALVDTYTITAGDVVSLDTGNYALFYPQVISNVPGIGDDEGFTLRGSSTGAAQLRHVLPGTNAPLLRLTDADFMTITGLDLSGGQYGLYADSGSSSLTVADLTLSLNREDGLYVGGNLLSLANVDTFGNQNHGIWVRGSVGPVTNVHAWENTAAGLYIEGNVHSVTDSEFHDNGGTGLSLGGAGSVQVLRNESYRNQNGLVVTGTTGSVIGGSDLTLGDGNLVYENRGNGISIGGDVLIAGNTVYGHASGTGISAGWQGGRVERNVVYGNRTGISSTNAPVVDNRVFGSELAISARNSSGNVVYSSNKGISGSIVMNNLIYDIGDVAIDSYGPQIIRNNTVDVVAATAIRIRSGQSPDIRNNILRLQDGTAFDLDLASQSGHHSDFNLFELGGTSVIGSWAGAVRSTLPDWQFASQSDGNSLIGTPSFVDPAGADGVIGMDGTSRGFDDDYHLQSLYGSFHGGVFAPVIDTASGLPALMPATESIDLVSSIAIDRGDENLPVGNEPSNNGGFINLGTYGGTIYASKSPTEFLFVTEPAAPQDWPAGQTYDVAWRTSDTNGTVDISLVPVGGGTPILIADDTENDGRFEYTVDVAIAPGDYTVRVESSAGSIGDSSVAVTLLGEVTAYYVNIAGDADFSDNQYTTAAGDVAATGTTPADPMPSLKQVLDTYDLEPGDLIYIDTGHYVIDVNIVIGADDSGVTITGPTDSDKTATFDRNSTAAGAAVITFSGASDIILSSLQITGAATGVLLATGSGNSNITISNNLVFGNITGITVGTGNIGTLIDHNEVFDNSSYGVSVAGDQTLVSNNRVFANRYGINNPYVNPAVKREIIGNEVFANADYGIFAYLAGTVARNNTVYGHRGTNDYGISAVNGAEVSENDVFDNYRGIYLGGGLVQRNRVFGNSFGVYASGSDGSVTQNVIYSNGQGIDFDPYSSYPYQRNGARIQSNLIYANETVGISLFGATTGSQVTGNTIYQVDGNAITVGNSTDVRLQNNIFAVGNGTAVEVQTDGQSGYASDYNLFSLGTGATAGRWGGHELADQADWTFELGMETNGLQDDPRFIDVDGVDDLLGFSRQILSSQIIDDGDAGFETNGTWTVNSTAGFSDDYLQGDLNDSGTATWTFTGLIPGKHYRVGVT
ncbi:MAG: right-handed parallel beta-helix repeat-containing protein, partial [Planctomycetales bacterium]|nr:right-handed parallel beta-helix repeat-containing protein [Planctomycetales bacterium]